MKSLLKDAFEVNLKSCYSNIFEQFTLWNVNGINERNLTCNFVNSLQASLKDKKSISCFEVPLKNETTRIDAVVYSPVHNAIFFIESKKFKRNQPRYIESLTKDIERLLETSNRDNIVAKIINRPVSLDQYLVIIADHWALNKSEVLVKEWFSKLHNVNHNYISNQGIENKYDNYYIHFENGFSDNEKYMIFLSCLKL